MKTTTTKQKKEGGEDQSIEEKEKLLKVDVVVVYMCMSISMYVCSSSLEFCEKHNDDLELKCHHRRHLP